jgi:transposase-like protein
MAKARRKRTKYSNEQRTQILDAARRDGLTAAQVQKKFGVTPVTYYSWRKKTGLAARRGRSTGAMRAAGNATLSGQVRSEVQTRVRQILPEIVRSEVSAYLNMVLGSGRRGPGRPRLR